MLAFVPAILAARPTAARVELQASKGEAAWFFRSCRDSQAGGVATWAVDPHASIPNRSALRIRVDNAYPGYRLACDLYFANSGKLPIAVKTIQVLNPHEGDLSVSALVAPGEHEKVIQPCGSRPGWGRDPASLPSNCRSKIEFALAIGPDVKENSSLDFSILVRLEEVRGGRNP